MSDKKDNVRDDIEKSIYDTVMDTGFPAGLAGGLAGGLIGRRLARRSTRKAEKEIFAREQQAMDGGAPLTADEQRRLEHLSKGYVGREFMGMFPGAAIGISATYRDGSAKPRKSSRFEK